MDERESKNIDAEGAVIGEDAAADAGEREKARGKSKDSVASLRKALAEEKARAEDYLANWQRTQADFVNYKRRVEQERDDIRKHAKADLILDLLPVMDDFERALGNASSDAVAQTWVDGVELIRRKLKSTLEASGLSEIKAVGEVFDPNIHEAAMQVDGDEGKVIEEIRKGYRLHDRVLRPSMVKVGQGKSEVMQEDAESKSVKQVQEESDG